MLCKRVVHVNIFMMYFLLLKHRNKLGVAIICSMLIFYWYGPLAMKLG